MSQAVVCAPLLPRVEIIEDVRRALSFEILLEPEDRLAHNERSIRSRVAGVPKVGGDILYPGDVGRQEAVRHDLNLASPRSVVLASFRLGLPGRFLNALFEQRLLV